MRRMATAVGVVLLVLCLGFFVWPTQWRYDDLREGQTTIRLRTNRFSDRVERLTARGWVAPTPFVPAPYVPYVSPTPMPVPSDQVEAIKGEASTSGTLLYITAYNGSQWRITSLAVDVAYGGNAARRYTMEPERRPNRFYERGLEPMTSRRFVVDLGLTPPRAEATWRIVGANGFAPTISGQ